MEQANKTHSHSLLRSYAHRLSTLQIACKGIALRGDPRDEICYKVRKIKADMLIMGSRGFGALKRTFMGSVSDYCVHHCPCPVTIVRKT
ncbi:hypothetical protein HK102_001129 [Quaeritorhiza haematococci]|nr:hypothetical protein HK102_001129 [Quaeritorhiza haematococci]